MGQIDTTQRTDKQGTPVRAFQLGANENETISGSAATTQPKPAGLYLISVNTDTHIAIGQDPTADNSDFLLPAGAVLPFVLNENDKVSGIQNSAGGTMSVAKLD